MLPFSEEDLIRKYLRFALPNCNKATKKEVWEAFYKCSNELNSIATTSKKKEILRKTVKLIMEADEKTLISYMIEAGIPKDKILLLKNENKIEEIDTVNENLFDKIQIKKRKNTNNFHPLYELIDGTNINSPIILTFYNKKRKFILKKKTVFEGNYYVVAALDNDVDDSQIYFRLKLYKNSKKDHLELIDSDNLISAIDEY